MSGLVAGEGLIWVLAGDADCDVDVLCLLLYRLGPCRSRPAQAPRPILWDSA